MIFNHFFILIYSSDLIKLKILYTIISEVIVINNKRMGRYERIHDQLKELIENKSPTLISAMSTIIAVLHHKMPHHFWTGFYFVSGNNELHVGPYQGSLACQILKDEGVCLYSVKKKRAVFVEDVEQFPGHIACDSRSKSEIVIPIFKGKDVFAVLDIDSEKLSQFDQDDIAPLTNILALLNPLI